jgi:excisionase family DNA binding protein
MWLTVKELSAYLKLKEKTVYYLVETGQIPHYRINTLIRFKKEEIDSWMASKKAKPLKDHLDRIIKSIYTAPEGSQTASGRR